MTSSKTPSAGFARRLLVERRLARRPLAAAMALVAFAAATGLGAAEWDLSGSVGIEARGFFEQPAFPAQLDGAQLSLIFEPQLEWEGDGGKHQLSLAPFFRLDSRDDERSHFDLREAYYRYVGSDWELLAGLNKVFWGVVESRHLVDVLNQDDATSDIDAEDKLGQPMVELTLLRDWGALSFYLLPYFRERTFSGTVGRLRPPLVVDTDNPVYESSAEEGHLDLAVRYSHFLGSWDLGFSYFNGTGREPRLVPDFRGERLLPHYDLIQQVGVDVQSTRGAWLLKLEAIAREGQGPTFGALVAGFEFTLYQIGSSAADLGLLAEVLYDDRDPMAAPATIFDNDLFVGSRLALNDVQDTSVLLGLLVDLEASSQALFVESERRLGNDWKLEIEGRFFFDVASEDLLASLEADDFLTLRISRFF